MKRVHSVCAALVFACVAAPAAAGQDTAAEICYPCVADNISELTHSIALWEASPDADEFDKAPAIAAADAEIRKLRAVLGPPRSQWPTPCCYSRKPLHIR